MDIVLNTVKGFFYINWVNKNLIEKYFFAKFTIIVKLLYSAITLDFLHISVISSLWRITVTNFILGLYIYG